MVRVCVKLNNGEVHLPPDNIFYAWMYGHVWAPTTLQTLCLTKSNFGVGYIVGKRLWSFEMRQQMVKQLFSKFNSLRCFVNYLEDHWKLEKKPPLKKERCKIVIFRFQSIFCLVCYSFLHRKYFNWLLRSLIAKNKNWNWISPSDFAFRELKRENCGEFSRKRGRRYSPSATLSEIIVNNILLILYCISIYSNQKTWHMTR
jgi:hypothetical protein